jgi:hypothetical protein
MIYSQFHNGKIPLLLHNSPKSLKHISLSLSLSLNSFRKHELTRREKKPKVCISKSGGGRKSDGKLIGGTKEETFSLLP